MENPNPKWMMTGGTPVNRTPHVTLPAFPELRFSRTEPGPRTALLSRIVVDSRRSLERHGAGEGVMAHLGKVKIWRICVETCLK